MPDEFSPVILLLNVLVIAGSCSSIALVIRKLAANQPLLPFEPRDESDAGGVFRWIRWAVIMSRHKEGDPPDPTISPPASHFWSDVRLGLLGFLVAFLPMIAVHVFLQQFVEYEHFSIEAFRKDRTLQTFLLICFETIVLASLLEEFLFRNLLQGLVEVQERMLVRRLGGAENWTFGVVPIMVSASAFAAGHWDQGAAAAPLFLFALVLGYLYYQTHRLLPCIVAHSALNAFTMVQLWFMG